MKKVKGLVNTILNIYNQLPHDLLQEIGENLYNMLLKKVDDLLDSLFRNDKMRWLACLMIEDDPDDEQLNYIENLQMLVRQLQHSAKESIPYNEVDKLSVLILDVRCWMTLRRPNSKENSKSWWGKWSPTSPNKTELNLYNNLLISTTISFPSLLADPEIFTAK